MGTRLDAVGFDAVRPDQLGRFWARALGWSMTLDRPDAVAVERAGAPAWAAGGPPSLLFVAVTDPVSGKNRTHLDLASPTEAGQRATVERLLGLGARRVDIGQGQVPWDVLADPEGNEFCVLEPRERYDGTMDVAAVVLDAADPAALARFWSEASGWPVLEAEPAVAALRHPSAPATWLELVATGERNAGANRVRLIVAPQPGADRDAEVARLERAGAQRVDGRHGGGVVLADPEGNELCLRPPR